MANNKNPNEKQPGENPDGKYHYNPGNMAGKKPVEVDTKDNPDTHSPDEPKPVWPKN
jgi:hypothetical protein